MHRLIEKYIKGTVSDEERKSVIKWLREHPENQRVYNRLKAAHVSSRIKDSKDISDTDSYSLIVRKKIKNQEKKKRYSYGVIGVIALLIPVLILFYQYGNDHFTNSSFALITERTSIGEQKEIVLPDGTQVVLNSGSILKYPSHFRGVNREVVLRGEALFDVTHNEEKPFIVKANEIDIRVLGTSFNVKSYKEDDNIETTLITGKVEILEDNKRPVLLRPSQKATFNKKSTELVVDAVKSEEIVAWQKGVLIFNETPMRQIVLDMERKYDVKFNIESKELLHYKYTGTFNDLTIEEVMRILKFSSPINYKIKGKQISLYMEK